MIGIYGGTFDPFHFGHLNLAIEIQEKCHLEEIWFCPAQINPHKLHQNATPAEHRMAMLQIAVAEIPWAKVIDLEIKKPGPSFTVETLRALTEVERTSLNPRQLALILGDDAISGFFHWREPEEIVQLAALLIGRRLPEPLNLEMLQGSSAICAAIKRGMTETHLIDISATEIRQRLGKGLYCGHLVPEKVLDYISMHHLYLKT